MCENLKILNNILNIIILIIAISIIIASVRNYFNAKQKSLNIVIKRIFYVGIMILILIFLKFIINNQSFKDNILLCPRKIVFKKISKVQNRCIYFQDDYKKYPYGNITGASIKDHGCGPTSVAVILCTMLNDTSYEPVRVTKDICSMGGCTVMGTNMKVLIKYLNSKGFKTTVHDMYYKIGNFNHDKAERDIYNALKNNNMVILHILNHFFVLNGLEGDRIKIVQVGDKIQSEFTYTYKELKELTETMTTIRGQRRYIQGYIIVSR